MDCARIFKTKAGEGLTEAVSLWISKDWAPGFGNGEE